MEVKAKVEEGSDRINDVGDEIPTWNIVFTCEEDPNEVWPESRLDDGWSWREHDPGDVLKSVLEEETARDSVINNEDDVDEESNNVLLLNEPPSNESEELIEQRWRDGEDRSERDFAKWVGDPKVESVENGQ